MIDVNFIGWIRYYSGEKTMEECRSHGSDHGAYGWSPQIDPRWTAEQKAAYVEGFESGKR